MSDSSCPAVIDWLVANIATLPACADPVLVTDGNTTDDAPVLVTVGGNVTPLILGEQAVQTIGEPESEMETYVIDVDIKAVVGADDQKTARDQVFTIFNAIRGLIRGNPTLGGLVPLFAHITSWSLHQTPEDEVDALTRSAELSTGVQVKFWLG